MSKDNILVEFTDNKKSIYKEKMIIDSLYKSRSSEHYSNMLNLIDAECFFSFGEPQCERINKDLSSEYVVTKCVATIELKNCYLEELMINVSIKNNSENCNPIIIDMSPNDKYHTKEISTKIELDINAEGDFQFFKPHLGRKKSKEIKETQKKCIVKTYGRQSNAVKWVFNNKEENTLEGDYIFYFLTRSCGLSEVTVNARVVVKTKFLGKFEFILDENLTREISFHL